VGKARLDIDIVERPEAVVVRPVGWLVASNYRTLQEVVEKQAQGGRRWVVIDLSVAQVLASPLLGAFIYFESLLAQRGGGLLLAAPLKSVRRLISAGGLEGKLTVCESVSAALRLVAAAQGTGN
jgi:anti-anti-sigma factor